jgi:hypothetical protein
MSEQDALQALLNEAELYQSQGLLIESKERFSQALEFMRENGEPVKAANLFRDIEARIADVEQELVEVSQEPERSDLSQAEQDLIRNLFSFSQDEASAAMEGAVALAKFGQYDKALSEFKRLLREGTMPVMAAKNIIRCYLSLASIPAAIAEFEQWVSGKILSEEDLHHMRAFLQEVLDKEGIQMELPSLSDADKPVTTDREGKNRSGQEVGPFDITTVIFEWEWGSEKIGPMEFNVPFQSGNNVSIIVSPQEAKVFKPGKRLMNVQFYTPIAVFRSTVAIKGQTQIDKGPKQGHYRLDFAIEGN